MKFQAHGIKTASGLEKCHYMLSHLTDGVRCITIYGKEHKRFSSEVRAAFTVQNDTDGMADYFENDRIRVHTTHPLFGAVADAYRKHLEFRQKVSKYPDCVAAQIADLATLTQEA